MNNKEMILLRWKHHETRRRRKLHLLWEQIKNTKSYQIHPGRPISFETGIQIEKEQDLDNIQTALRTGTVSANLKPKLIHGALYHSLSQAGNRSRDLRTKVAITGDITVDNTLGSGLMPSQASHSRPKTT